MSVAQQIQSYNVDTIAVRQVIPLKYDYNTYPQNYIFITDENGIMLPVPFYEYVSTNGFTSTIISSATGVTLSTISTGLYIEISTALSQFGTSSLVSIIEGVSTATSYGLSTVSTAVGEAIFSTTTTLSSGLGLLSTVYTNYSGWFDVMSTTTRIARFTDTGRFGIGCIPENSYLDVSGSALFTGGVSINKPLTSARFTDFDVSGNSYFTGTVLASNFATPSDKRLKDNIFVVCNALSSVRELQGVHFNWKASGERDIGVIAQETQKVLPEAVSVSKGDSNTLVVSYEKIIPLLIESVKELEDKVNALKEELRRVSKQ
jgi:hypothetical protein